MPDVTISVGGKDFTVACRDGEEEYLRSAAQMLDTEAMSLVSQIGALPDARMLLMAGLLLADRTAASEERAVAAETKLKEAETAQGDPEAEARLAALAEAAEALAQRAEAAADAATP